MEVKSGCKLGGVFECEIYDKHGNLKWTERAHNVITDQGENHIINAVLAGATQITTWYCLLVETNTTASGTMTYAVPVFTESTAYDEVTRPIYAEVAAAGGTTTNSANKGTFTINDTKTMFGAALVGGGTAAMTKGDVASAGGVLFSFGTFTTNRAVVAADVVNLTYTVSAQDDAV